eukprot:m.170068 g.170068  ORF g.170068 m.170068 type:complete len:962 (-) comp16678_c0_seq7:1832-4717(-)
MAYAPDQPSIQVGVQNSAPTLVSNDIAVEDVETSFAGFQENPIVSGAGESPMLGGFRIPSSTFLGESSTSPSPVEMEDDPDSSDDEEELKKKKKRLAAANTRAPAKRKKAYVKPAASNPRSNLTTMANGDTVDYVFVIEIPEDKADIAKLEGQATRPPSDSDDDSVKQTRKRRIFLENCLKEGMKLEHEISPDGSLQFIRAHVTFERLMVQAEINNLGMTLKPEVSEKLHQALKSSAAARLEEGVSCLTNFFSCLEPDVEDEPDSFSAPFKVQRLQDFVNCDKEDVFFTTAQRSDLTYSILNHISYGKKASHKGLAKLVANGSFIGAYPLHDGLYGEDAASVPVGPQGNDRAKLYDVWGRLGCWYLLQPYDLIRRYFGVKIGLYFAWLGFYTLALIAPSVLGVLVFIAGVGSLGEQDDVNDICDSNVTMCAICDNGCERWTLSDSCGGYKFAYIFDNPGTVAFATFMALWASVFLDFWKRRENFLAYDWDTRDYEDLEPLRPQFRGTTKRPNPVTGKMEKHYPAGKRYAKQMGSSLTMLSMIGVVIVIVVGILFYRLAVKASLFQSSGNAENASLITSITAAILNLVAIMLLSYLYRGLAVTLTEWENHRLDSEYQSALTVKIFMFQFANNYASLFYIAFFKGRFTGIPGDYNYFFGFRQDECPSDLGCMGELTLQLAIVFVGRQTINNFQEMILPAIMRWWRKRSAGEEFERENKAMTPWERDYFLDPFPGNGMFNEYLELMLQYGYITMFVPAFSLAPLFAFLNNIFEIRIDAHKLLVDYRRPPGIRAADIGVWFDVLSLISFFAVVINAMVIAFTSSFIQRQVFLYEEGSLDGYIARITPESPVKDVTDDMFGCHYMGLRDPDGSKGVFFFQVLAAQLAFVVVFEHFVFLIKVVVAHVIPDVPKTVQLAIKRENYLAQQALEGDMLGTPMQERVRAASESRHSHAAVSLAGPAGYPQA